MKFIVESSCPQCKETMAVEIANEEVAIVFAEEHAIELWGSYQSNYEYLEEEEIEQYSDSWWDTVYHNISYSVKPFNYNDSYDLSILREQGNDFFFV